MVRNKKPDNGLQRTPEEFTPAPALRAKTPMKDAGDILASVLKHRHLEKKFEEYSGFPYWKEVVGEEIAKVAIPQRLIAKKVLVVRVIDAVWAQELAIRKPELLDKLATIDTGALIEDIRFVTGNPKDFKTS